MQFRLIGPVTASTDDREGRIGEPKHRLLLAILLAADGRMVPADRLINLMWEERLPASPKDRLYEYVGALRANLRAIDPSAADILSQHDGGYQLLVQPGQLDVNRFQQLVIEAKSTLTTNNSRTIQLLERALEEWPGEDTDLYGAEPLTGLSGTWVDSYRAGLRAIRHEAILMLLNAKLRLGRNDEVIAKLVGPVTAGPPDEGLGRVLMLAYHCAGRSQEALFVYSNLRRRLYEEFGKDPGQQLEDLQRRIQRQDASLCPAQPEPDHSTRSSPSAAPPQDRPQPDQHRTPNEVEMHHGGIYFADQVTARDIVSGDKYVGGGRTRHAPDQGGEA